MRAPRERAWGSNKSVVKLPGRNGRQGCLGASKDSSRGCVWCGRRGMQKTRRDAFLCCFIDAVVWAAPFAQPALHRVGRSAAAVAARGRTPYVQTLCVML